MKFSGTHQVEGGRIKMETLFVNEGDETEGGCRADINEKCGEGQEEKTDYRIWTRCPFQKTSSPWRTSQLPASHSVCRDRIFNAF